MKTSKGLSWLALAAITLSGPLGPLSASAQEQPSAQLAPPSETPRPAPSPAAPVAPGQVAPSQVAPSEVAPGQVAPGQMQGPPLMLPPPPQSEPAWQNQAAWGPDVISVEPTPGDEVGARFLNVVYVPGKAILCGAGAVMATFLMLVTFGTAYPTATGLFREGCAGTWVLTAEHVSGKIPPDWVRTDGYQTYYPAGGVYYQTYPSPVGVAP